MNVSLHDITRIFDEVISGQRSRESVAEWASTVQRQKDCGHLTFFPSCEEAAIWRAILYLTGIDLKTSPNEYLHPLDDLAVYRASIER